MTPEELDRILSADDFVQPAPSFTRSVMSAVHREADEPPRLRFPWVRFGVGVTASAAAAATATVLLTGSGLPLSGAVSAAPSIAPELVCTLAVALIGFGIAAIPRVLIRS
jgi:hypothetical protein